MSRRFAKLVCAVRGHAWRDIRVNAGKASALGHLSSVAGVDADCDRCGERWRDAGEEGEGSDGQL